MTDATRDAASAPKRDARSRIHRWSAALTLLGGIWTFVVAVWGGFSFTVFGILLRSHDWRRPLIVSVLAFAIVYLTGGRSTIAAQADVVRTGVSAAWPHLVRIWRRGYVQLAVTVLIAGALLIVGILRGSTAAGGSDSYGYLSEAELWLKGRLAISQPWVKDVPWPNAVWGFAPLGYTPSRQTRFTLGGYGPTQDPWAIVPTYSAGFPMLMALGKAIGGVCGPFVVVPLSGALLILSTYLIGLRLGSPTLGMLAAILVAASPPFLLMHFVNMSDVPVAAAFTLACAGILGTTVRSAIGASVAMALVLLIRPNLAPLFPIFLLWLGWRVLQHPSDRKRHIWRAVIVIAGVGGALVTTMLMYWFTYGTPFESGYGNTAAYFSLSHVAPNARNYAGWFTEVHTALGFLGLLALALPVRALWRDVADRSAVAVFALLTAGVVAEFLVYLELDNSSYLRFFLVCYPFIMLGLASLAMTLHRIHRVIGLAVASVLVMVVVGRGLSLVPVWHILNQGTIEAAYPEVAEHVRNATPHNSVVLAMNHSGSIRYYAGRVTMRWDNLQADWLDRAVAWMAERGVHTYALLDEFELPEVIRHFKGQQLVAILEGPPVFRYGNKVFFDLGLPPGAHVDTIELSVIDRPLKCWVPAEPPHLVWKH
jgi:hypothetical protein